MKDFDEVRGTWNLCLWICAYFRTIDRLEKSGKFLNFEFTLKIQSNLFIASASTFLKTYQINSIEFTIFYYFSL